MAPGERPRSLGRAWAAGDVTIGAACKIPSSLAAEAVAAAGFDYVYVDQQHGVLDNAVLVSMFQAIAGAGAAPVTRVPSKDGVAIGRALDFGAFGVIVPDVETADEAAEAVAACRYPPRGVRSHGALRPKFAQPASDPDDPGRAACIALVESARGLENVDAIASTAGLDAIMIGMQDLTLSLGLPLKGDWLSAPRLVDALEEIRLACRRHGITAGIGTTSGASAAAFLKQGFQMVNVGNDLAHLASALAAHLATARAAATEGRAVSAQGR